MTFTILPGEIVCDRCQDSHTSPFASRLRAWKLAHMCDTPWSAK